MNSSVPFYPHPQHQAGALTNNRATQGYSRWTTPLSCANKVVSIAVEEQHYLTVKLTVEQGGKQELWLVTFPYGTDYAVRHRALSTNEQQQIGQNGWTTFLPCDDETSRCLIDRRCVQQFAHVKTVEGELRRYRFFSEKVVVDVWSEAKPEFRRLAASGTI